MKISFCGAQSTGKTTLLNECKDIYSEFLFVDEVTRKVKRDFNVNINELGGDETQLLILSEHIKNHMLSGNVFLDRCILDGIVYTKYLHNKGQVSKKVLDAYVSVFDILYNKLDFVFYTEPADVKLVDDGVRSINSDFRSEIVEIFEDMLKTYNDDNKIVRLKGSVVSRLQTIEKNIKNE